MTYTVQLGKGWRLYAQTLPAGAQALGTITRERGEVGALILTTAGVYAQANAGAIKSLDQRQVDAARLRAVLEAAGLSQRGAARDLGIDERTMRRYVAGDAATPRVVWLALEAIAAR